MEGNKNINAKEKWWFSKKQKILEGENLLKL
jgi:hypothetical protein